MAFVVVTSLLELVEQQLLQPNPCLLHLDDRETIVSLRDKLHFLQAFSEESEMKTHDPEAKKMVDTEIQDVATKAEGQIGSKLRQVYLAANANGGECLVEACQQLYQTLQQVLNDIQAVEVRILVQNPNFNSIASSSTNDTKEENIMVGVSTPNDLNPEDVMIVGLDEETKRVIDLLRDPWSFKRQVISIIGIGGMGKTTLAKRIYEHHEIRYHFQIRAWIVVSREHNVKEMLIHLLDCILPVTSEISNKGEVELAEKLHKSLMGKRYLIVLDDIWIIEAWVAIQLCFPDNFDGSRILITTRFQEVGNYLSELLFPMKFLTNDECWEIISRKIFEKRCYPSKFEELGQYISKLCRGIPLEVVLIGGLLATANESFEIWEDVAKTLATTYGHADNTILEIITSLCYNYLPSHLKACFLYFGVFPEDSIIHVKKLVNLWVAEGFLKLERNKSLEEVAKICLYDLINRNLVQIDKRSVDGKIKTCKIRDRVHEMCVREAKKKNIMSLLNENHGLETCRWISCQSSYQSFEQVMGTTLLMKSVLFYTLEEVSTFQGAGWCTLV